MPTGILKKTSSQKPVGRIQGQGGDRRRQRRSNVAEFAKRFDLHANHITQWKSQLPKPDAGIFDAGSPPPDQGPDGKELHAKIGQLARENNLLERALGRRQDASARASSIAHTPWPSSVNLIGSRFPKDPCTTPERRSRTAARD